MPAVFNKDGTATAYGLAVSPFTGWQHGRIDSSAIAHVASFARRSCQVAGWIDISPYRDPTRTTFAVAHEVRVNPKYESRFIQVTDRCYAICTVSHVGNSSCSFLTKVYLTPKNIPEPTEEQLKEHDYHDWVLSQAKEKGNEEGGPIELGMTTLTLVYISTETRKSVNLHEGLRKLLEDGARNKSLTSDWKVRGNNDRLKINFGLMTRSATKFLAALEQSALVFSSASIAGGSENIVSITNATASSSANNQDITKPAVSVDIISSLNDVKGGDSTVSPSQFKHMAIFTSRRALRPADFDFNLHMNMNMYVSAVLDALKYAMRDFLDLQRKQQSLAKKNSSSPTSESESPNALADKSAAEKPNVRGTPIVSLDYQFPVIVIDLEEKKPKKAESTETATDKDATTKDATAPSSKVTVHHLGEVLGRLGYQSVVSKFTNKSHNNRPDMNNHGDLGDSIHHQSAAQLDYLSRQTSTPSITATANAAPKRDAYDMTRFVSVEECVISSRIEYHQEVTELTSELEVTIMIAPPSSEAAADSGTPTNYFSVNPDTLRISENQADHPNLPIHYLVRCIPPAWVDNPTPFVASSGEIVLRPVDSIPVYLPVLPQEMSQKKE